MGKWASRALGEKWDGVPGLDDTSARPNWMQEIGSGGEVDRALVQACVSDRGIMQRLCYAALLFARTTISAFQISAALVWEAATIFAGTTYTAGKFSFQIITSKEGR